MEFEVRKNSFGAHNTADNSSSSHVPPEKSQKLADNYEPIDIEGQKQTGVWVHHPGSEVSPMWEPRKGKSRRLDTEIHREPNDLVGSGRSTESGSLNNDSSSSDNNPEEKHRMRSFRRGLHKIGSVFHRNKGEEPVQEDYLSPHDNIRSMNAKGMIGVKFVMDENISDFPTSKGQEEGGSIEESGSETPAKGHAKDVAKNFLKQAGKSARGLKQVISCKAKKSKGESQALPERVNESDSSDDDESTAVERISVSSEAMAPGSNGSPSSKVYVVQTVPSNTHGDNEVQMDVVYVKDDPEKACSPERSSKEFVKSDELEHVKEEIAGR